MNNEFTSHFAKQLTANSSLFDEARNQLLADHITSYVDGALSHDDAAEVAALIATNPSAKTIHANILSARAFLASDDGKAWLMAPLGSVVSVRPDVGKQTSSFFARLSEWMPKLFGEGLLRESYAADATGDEIVKRFPSATGDPFEAKLVKDATGRWFLRVFTKDPTAAAGALVVEMEPEAPVLHFAPVTDSFFAAEVRISESMAEALKEGHRPVFRPAE